MQELRLVAVSEDGSYLVLATAGRGTRFTLPVDDRLRAAVRGHFSRLGQFEIEVESPLRPKEIQARIRAGETAEEIAESAGIPVERVRWFEGPVLQEREYMAQQAQRVVVRRQGDASPAPPLGEMVEERLGRRGVDLEEVEWDSWKCEDSTWRVRLSFFDKGRPQAAEWVFDPRRRQISPLDEDAARLSSVTFEEPAPPPAVTPLSSRRPAMKIVSDARPAEPRRFGDPPRRPWEPVPAEVAELERQEMGAVAEATGVYVGDDPAPATLRPAPRPDTGPDPRDLTERSHEPSARQGSAPTAGTGLETAAANRQETSAAQVGREPAIETAVDAAPSQGATGTADDPRDAGSQPPAQATAAHRIQGAPGDTADHDAEPAITSERPATTDLRPEPADVRPQVTDVRPEVTDVRPEVTDVRPQVADVPPEVTDVRREPANVRPQVADVRPEPADVRPEVAASGTREEVATSPDAHDDTTADQFEAGAAAGRDVPADGRADERGLGAVARQDVQRDVREDGRAEGAAAARPDVPREAAAARPDVPREAAADERATRAAAGVDGDSSADRREPKPGATSAPRPGARSGAGRKPAPAPRSRPEPKPDPAAEEVAEQAAEVEPVAAAAAAPETPAPTPAQRGGRRKAARGKRASVPSWDEIMFGARRPD